MMVLVLSILSGILGRMGGAQGYNTRWRDIGCSLVVLLTLFVLFGFHLSLWWIYLLIFGLHWAILSTYWDWLFKEDNLWFSGFACGLMIMPINTAINFILIRSVILGVVWGCLNKYLPSAGIAGNKRILFWRRDIVEEFLRYFFVPLTLIIMR